MILFLALGFMVASLKNIQEGKAGIDKFFKEYAAKNEQDKSEKGLLEEDLEKKSLEPFPVFSNPLAAGTQIDIPVKNNYFIEYKLERDRIRSRQIEILREIVNNPNSVTENRMEAQQRLFMVSDNLENELELENLLAAKGFTQTAILIQPASVTIVVGKAKLAQEDLARIADLAVKTTGYKIEDIIIIPLQENSK
jgi:hypothetical protein